MGDKKKKPDFRKWSNKYLSSSDGLPPFSKGGIGEGKKLFCSVCLKRVGSAKAYIDKFDDVVYCCEDCNLSKYYDVLRKTKIVFDLDGVIRDLNLYLQNKYQIPYPQEWFWTYKGKDIYQWAEHDKLCILNYSPVTEYFGVISEHFLESKKIEIWTCQPEDWKPLTLEWMCKHFGTGYEVKFLNGKEKRLKLDSEPNTFLVEDSPQFEDYKRIILINRPYNKNLNVPMRINNERELERFLRKVRASQT